jgi:hypothetical protein
MQYAIGGAVMQAAGLSGIDLTIKCIGAITTSAHSICTLISYIPKSTSNKTVNISRTLESLDIDHKVKVLSSLIKDLRIKKSSDTLKLCLNEIKDIVIQIDKNILVLSPYFSATYENADIAKYFSNIGDGYNALSISKYMKTILEFVDDICISAHQHNLQELKSSLIKIHTKLQNFNVESHIKNADKLALLLTHDTDVVIITQFKDLLVNIKDDVHKLNIQSRLKMIDTIVEEVKTYKHSFTLSLCLTGLENCLKKIEDEITQIHNKVKFNEELWIFKSWRCNVFDENVLNIESLSRMLDNRKEMFFNVLNVETQLISEQSLIIVRQQIKTRKTSDMNNSCLGLLAEHNMDDSIIVSDMI